ncbi:cupin domain-containing protein [Granulicatella seriolae]|uniref:Cupin domain-containing protein n=1 Tax=Granulicatella seriolae TaxID=2967226 RepID=A0ABT1WS55_9LACT|nr:cupin domain-containing protein [Granulicatella seriolae]
MELKDFGPKPLVINIEEATLQNDNFRTTLWTGPQSQVTLMTIEVGGDIGLEAHHNIDQFLRIEEGHALVQMGDAEDNLTFKEEAHADYAVIVPAGKFHNLTNIGDVPLKLYSIYSPADHAFGTVHKTRAEADLEEH